uniref:Protein phosphatase 1, regulatory (inhibitor) subunit 2 n=1 Tax=Hucho hucho TaxID=62062 RepID=A0A4W5NG97_9TELE
MADSRLIKGILKNKNSGTGIKVGPAEEVPVEAPEQATLGLLEDDPQKKSQKWDEMNILATYHPADKDYGMMKIDEPSTPYNRMVEDEGVHSDSEGNVPNVDDLASKLAAAEGKEPRFMREEEEEEEESSEEDELTPEEQVKKKQFQKMRKMHYNEGLNIRMARQLIANELAEDEDEEMRDETEDINVDSPQDALDS